MMERVLDVEVSRYETIIKEIEFICTMTGFRRRFLGEHAVDGLCHSMELGAR